MGVAVTDAHVPSPNDILPQGRGGIVYVSSRLKIKLPFDNN